MGFQHFQFTHSTQVFLLQATSVAPLCKRRISENHMLHHQTGGMLAHVQEKQTAPHASKLGGLSKNRQIISEFMSISEWVAKCAHLLNHTIGSATNHWPPGNTVIRSCLFSFRASWRVRSQWHPRTNQCPAVRYLQMAYPSPSANTDQEFWTEKTHQTSIHLRHKIIIYTKCSSQNGHSLTKGEPLFNPFIVTF